MRSCRIVTHYQIRIPVQTTRTKHVVRAPVAALAVSAAVKRVRIVLNARLAGHSTRVILVVSIRIRPRTVHDGIVLDVDWDWNGRGDLDGEDWAVFLVIGGISGRFQADDEIFVTVGMSMLAFLQFFNQSRRGTDQEVRVLVSLERTHRSNSFKQDSSFPRISGDGRLVAVLLARVARSKTRFI